MVPTEKHNERIRTMKFSGVYPHYVTKVEKKGRTVEELHTVMRWLTDYDEATLAAFIASPTATFEDFFADATLPAEAEQIKGVICGYRIEEIENELTRRCRYLDKLVDELARGRKLEKVLRSV